MFVFCICTLTCSHVYMYICVFVCIFVRLHVCVQSCTFARMFVCVLLCVAVHLHVLIRMCICLSTCSYVYLYTLRDAAQQHSEFQISHLPAITVPPLSTERFFRCLRALRSVRIDEERWN